MSMNASYRAVSGALAAAILADPSLAIHAVNVSTEAPTGELPFPPEMRAMFETMSAERKEAMLSSPKFAKFRAMLARESAVSEGESVPALEGVGFGRQDLREPLNIDKAWHGLHFILAGTLDRPTPPPGDAVLGGTPVGEDLGYGPARVMTSEEVRATSGMLAQLSEADIATRFQPGTLSAAGIYPGQWESEPGAKDWIVDSFRNVSTYFGEASARGDGLLIYIT